MNMKRYILVFLFLVSFVLLYSQEVRPLVHLKPVIAGDSLANLEIFESNDSINIYIDDVLYGANFVESNFDPEFRFGMRLLKKRNALNNAYTNLEKYFYYNHNGWDVVFCTNTPIDFKNNGKEKIISLNIDRSKNDKKFEDIWVNYDVYNTGISKIKFESVYTRYGDEEYFYNKINKSMSKKYGNNCENH